MYVWCSMVIDVRCVGFGMWGVVSCGVVPRCVVWRGAVGRAVWCSLWFVAWCAVWYVVGGVWCGVLFCVVSCLWCGAWCGVVCGVGTVWCCVGFGVAFGAVGWVAGFVVLCGGCFGAVRGAVSVARLVRSCGVR